MPIATRCTHCGKAYQVAESTLGKQVKCQACGKPFVVAAATAAAASAGKPAPRSNVNTGAASQADSGERARIAKLEAEFGLQPIPPNPNQVFPSTEYQRPRGAANPLANHVVEDPGFEDISEADYAAHRKAEAQAKHEAALRYAPVDDLDPSSGNSGGGIVALIIALVLLAVVGVGLLFMFGVL